MDARKITTRHSEIARVFGAAGEQHGVVIALQRLDTNILAHMDIAVEGHAFGFHLCHAALDDVFLHFEVGDAVAEQAAGMSVLLVDMHVMAGAAELLCRGEASRSGADDGHALAGLGLRGLRGDPALVERLVCDGAFDGLDGHRLVDDVERAGSLAGRRADASRDLGEVVGRMEVPGRVAPVGVIDEVVPVRDLVVDRASGLAIGDAAIHAASGLAHGLGVARGDHELLVMAHAIRGRLITPVLPINLKKSRDLAH